ncbi:MAG: hypothetical protein M1829_006230 [Trizodia sp. TS-e1964]|nr:MAG: hypothetical protein M1829_006230 [Trizodia sp. TS-e1964]
MPDHAMPEVEVKESIHGELIQKTGRKDVKSRPTDIRVPKHKPTVQLIFLPIHLATNYAEKRLAINQHPDPILLYNFIKRPSLLDIVQMVRKPAAPAVLNPHPNEPRIRLRKEPLEMDDGV